MKNNLEPYLSWLLAERPFAAPNRGGPGDISKIPKVQSTSEIVAESTAISTAIKSSNSTRAAFVDPAPVQQKQSWPTVTSPNLSLSDRQHALAKASFVHFAEEEKEEDMARLRIEPTPKRPKLSSALQTPRGNISSSPPETVAVKSTSKKNYNVPNPYGIYQPLHFTVIVWRSDESGRYPSLYKSHTGGGKK